MHLSHRFIHILRVCLCDVKPMWHVQSGHRDFIIKSNKYDAYLSVKIYRVHATGTTTPGAFPQYIIVYNMTISYAHVWTDFVELIY